MGGAERAARKRRQQQQSAGAKAVARARGGGANKRVIAAVVAVVLLAGAVIGGVIWTNASKNATEGQTITPRAAPAALDSANELQGVVVTSGSDTAKVKLDIYADFLCPFCAQLHKKSGQQIEEQIQAGTLQVRYHMIPLLNDSSDPPGYSLDSANAAMCMAKQGKFTPYHDSLFAQQPEEGKRGYDKAQLIQLGTDLGVTDPAFAACVNAGTYNDQLDTALKDALNMPNFKGTPAVMDNGTLVDWTTDGWLDQLVASQG